MAQVIMNRGGLIVMAKFLHQQGGLWYYRRRIPEDIRKHVAPLSASGKPQEFRMVSLKTKVREEAIPSALKLASEDDKAWAAIRGAPEGTTPQPVDIAARKKLKALELKPGALVAEFMSTKDIPYGVMEVLEDHFVQVHGPEWLDARDSGHPEDLEPFISTVDKRMLELLREDPNAPKDRLSDALENYLKEHEKGTEKSFLAETKRAIQAVYDAVGDFPLPKYTRAHANIVRDRLLEGRKTETAKRRINTIKAVFTSGIRELEIDAKNPFQSLKIKNLGDDTTHRDTFTELELVEIAEGCRSKGDDIRCLIAIQLDTGTRIGEVVGLRVEDVRLDGVPRIAIREEKSLGRTLKTDASTREVPLVGEALWGVQRAMKLLPKGSEWLFPRYARDGEIDATGASATVNKWLEGRGIAKTSHSFRHTMRDRLRAVGATEDICDAIGGWAKKGEGRKYGKGYTQEHLRSWLLKVVLSDPLPSV